MNYAKKLILGITGSIAIYKICELIRLLIREGIEIIPVMTPDSRRFISPLLIESLSRSKVYSDMFDEAGGTFYHIMLSRGVPLILIAPATANTIAKISQGLADNLLITMVLASDSPVLIAPAMNVKMFNNEITKQNIERLKRIKRFSFIEPESGELACGDVGEGRLADIRDIFDATMYYLFTEKILRGKKILITAGPTREFLDNVRFLSNPSSGKMGYELARVAYWLGADVTLISGPVEIRAPYGVNLIKVVSAEEMKEAVLGVKDRYDLLIMNAAISDWRFKEISTHKLKRGGGDLNITLKENDDILFLSSKSGKFKYIVGFAAESEDIIENAKAKIEKKGIDVIIVNDISRRDIGFGQDYNEGKVIFKDGEIINLERATKREIAMKILSVLAGRIR